MPRPHTEFIHSLAQASSGWSRPGLGPGIQARVLSHDPLGGGSSLVLSYPAGYRSKDTALAVAEELFVMDGSVEIAGIRFDQHHYGFLPPGTSRSEVASSEGATVLCFFDAEPITAAENPAAKLQHQATAEMPWGPGIADPNLQFMGLGRKVLRDDPERQERVLLLTMAPQAYPNDQGVPQIAHPCVEEMYLFSGDVISEYGVMQTGAYFWRPPMIFHGPHGSRHGAFMMVRFVEGRHENIWAEEPSYFDPHPSLRPVIPTSQGMDA
ncbi:MAG: DUF4437 domain-containing protein [Gammaproteobacteria bacterium]